MEKKYEIIDNNSTINLLINGEVFNYNDGSPVIYESVKDAEREISSLDFNKHLDNLSGKEIDYLFPDIKQ